MAASVFPVVKLLFACDTAFADPMDAKWVLKNPWSVVMLPPGATFPFRAEDFRVYAHLTDGLGEFEVSVQLRHLRDDDTFRTTGSRQDRNTVVFSRRGQSVLIDVVFEFKNAPFREAGRYEFCVVANGQVGSGQTAALRVLDRSNAS